VAPLASGQFAAGACMAMAPTGPDRHATVFLDAGHGGPDPGAAGFTTTGQAVDERDLTLPVVLDAASVLRAAGYRVVVSRLVDTAVASLGSGDLSATGELSVQGEHADTEARVSCANLSGAKVLVSVHFNAFSDASAAGLLTTYDDSRPFSTANAQFAQLLDTDVHAALGSAGWSVPDRGVQPDTTVGAPALTQEAHDYGHLLLLGPAAPGWLEHPTTMPGALVEPLFLTDPTEASVAADPAGQRAIAAGVADAAEAFTGVGPAATDGRP
jgi:N-acetylmuramoyl-L-alanine amidase